MAYTPDRADAVRFKVNGVEVHHLDAIGTVAGVTIDFAAAANGEGTGLLRKTVNEELCWRPPGEAAFGPPVDISAGGVFRLEDSNTGGAKFIRVSVNTGFVAPWLDESRVFLRRAYNNGIAGGDVTAAESAAGVVTTYTVAVVNEGPLDVASLLVWIDSAAGIELSADGATWSTPTNGTSDFLSLGALAANGGSATLHLRRTIIAGATADPDVLTHLKYSYVVIVYPP